MRCRPWRLCQRRRRIAVLVVLGTTASSARTTMVIAATGTWPPCAPAFVPDLPIWGAIFLASALPPTPVWVLPGVPPVPGPVVVPPGPVGVLDCA